MSQIETALRGGVIALILVLGALAARDARRSPADWVSVLFALSGVAYLVESAPALGAGRQWWLLAIRVVSIATPAVFWSWVRAQVDDRFVPSWRDALVWLGMATLAAWAITADRLPPWHVVQAAGLALVGLGIWRTLAGRGGDLVEGRRRLRLVLAVGAALYIVALEIIAFATMGRGGLMMVVATELVLAGYVAAGIAARVLHPALAPAVADAPLAGGAAATARPDPEETRLLDALDRAMAVDKAYREDRCSVPTLAARLGIPEYRLRRLINQRLGHRNFTSYVNGYRLAEATAALADPSQVRVSILTIALDAGFGSLGPFNRAFKAHTGMTPSAYRRARLGDAATAEPRDTALPPGSPIPKSARA